MNQQTALQELIQWMEDKSKVIPFAQEDCYNKALELLAKEKQQIIDAFSEGASDGFWGAGDSNKEEYYNEKYNK